MLIPFYIASAIYLYNYRSPLKKNRRMLERATILVAIWGIVFVLAFEYYLMKIYKHDYIYTGYGEISDGNYIKFCPLSFVVNIMWMMLPIWIGIYICLYNMCKSWTEIGIETYES